MNPAVIFPTRTQAQFSELWLGWDSLGWTLGPGGGFPVEPLPARYRDFPLFYCRGGGRDQPRQPLGNGPVAYIYSFRVRSSPQLTLADTVFCL